MECTQIPIISPSEFRTRILEKVEVSRIPFSGMIEPTFRCNLKCAHCYVAYDRGKEELAYEGISDIIDKIVEAGCLYLCFSGGEPFVRNDFLDIYTYAKKRGLLITLFTNGTLITPEIADYLQKWPPLSVEISLYGISRETYENVTRIPGSFDRCMKGIRLLLERKIPLRIKTVVLTLNYQELWNIKRYVEELGVEFMFDPYIAPKLDGDRGPCKFRIPAEEVVKLERADQRRYKKWIELCKRFKGHPKPKYLYTCGAGLNSFVINPFGELQICVISRAPSYNLLSGTFSEGFYDFFPEIRSQKLSCNHECDNCDMYFLCHKCPGWSRLEYGDPETPLDYLCQVAHLHANLLEKGPI